MTITLYELQPSPHARKVRLLAAELGIPLNKVPVDPRIGETRTAYLAKNPNGRVPTLEEDGFVLYESPRSSNISRPRPGARAVRRRCQDAGSGRSMDLLVGRRSRSGHGRARLGDADQA